MNDYPRMSFDEWLGHWGERKLVDNIASSKRCHRRMWESRDDESGNKVHPVWELKLGAFWRESMEEWQERWRSAGGRIIDNRMMAPKWSSIWDELADSFPDGFGRPYPPYARYTCVYWGCVCDDEAIVLGVITEDEFQERMKRISEPLAPLLGGDGNPLNIRELLGDDYEKLVAYGNKSRLEKFEEKKERQREASERNRLARIEQDFRVEKERKEKNAAFRMLERIEGDLKSASSEKIIEESTALFSSLRMLVQTEHFERYPKWRARAWKCAAMVHRELGDSLWEMDALRNALSSDSQIGVKRRLKTLERKTTG